MSDMFDEDPRDEAPAERPPSRRSRALVITAVVLVLAFFALTTFANFYTNVLWYRDIGFGSVYSRLGAEVEVVEYLDRILPGIDGEVSKTFHRMLERQGFTFHLGQKVSKVEPTNAGASVTFAPVAGGDERRLDADVVLVATGRRPVTEGLGLEAAGIATERGRVVIDERFETSVPGIYAIGDVVRGLMLAHKAEDEGVAVAEILAGQAGHVNYGVIPAVVYTMPEIASVGATEEELKAAGIPYTAGKFPYTANGRARATRHMPG